MYVCAVAERNNEAHLLIAPFGFVASCFFLPIVERRQCAAQPTESGRHANAGIAEVRALSQNFQLAAF
jgi:hypothetical protein